MEGLEIHLAPKTLFKLFGIIPVTDSIVMMWIIMAIMIVLALIIRANLKFMPGKFQNFVEWALGGMYDFMENIGGKATKQHFPIFITFFLVILFSNWLGMIMGTVAEKLGFLRAPTSDLNTTAALAIIAFIYFEYQAIKVHGLFGWLGHFVNLKALRKGPMGFIDFFVGLLHIISELVRPLALALRLFGNVFGGEIILTVGFLLVRGIVPVPFMMLETMTGIVQAAVFSILFLTFTSLNTAHSEEEHH